MLWLPLPCSHFAEMQKIDAWQEEHQSSIKLFNLSLEAHLSGIFSGKSVGEKLESFTYDWHCKHRTLGSRKETLLEQGYQNWRNTCRQKYMPQFLIADQ